MRAYIQIPFQETPAVLGDVSKAALNKVIDGAVPRNLPSDWFQDPSIKILSAFWVNSSTLAISVTVRGKKDRANRENLLSHVVLSDEDAFLLDPISALMKLDAMSSDPKVATTAGLEAVMAASKSIIGEESNLASWVKRIKNFDEDFFTEALFTPINAESTYIGYEKESDLMEYLRAFFITMQPVLGNKCSFVSIFGSFESPESMYTVKCFKTDSKGVQLDKDDKSALKEQKAALIDIPRQKVHEKGKKSKIIQVLLDELSDKPWVGMDRIAHLSMVHNIIRQRVSGKAQKMTPFAEDLLQTVERLEKIEKTKID